MARVVNCAKLGRELPGLNAPPVPGPLGQRIYDEISEDAWKMWLQQQTILINHYGLNLADPATRKLLMQQMEEFFFGEHARMPEGWVAPSAKGGGVAAKK